MITEITRTQDPDAQNSFVVQRINNGTLEVLKEIIFSTGEITDRENEFLTVETITITRRIGSKTQF